MRFLFPHKELAFFTGNGSNRQVFVTFQRNAFYTFRQLNVRQVKDVAGNDFSAVQIQVSRDVGRQSNHFNSSV